MTRNGEKREKDGIAAPDLWKEPELVRPPKSISDQIYDLLKKKILNSEILPGERLMQEEVARAYHASRTPVRQAFHMLEKDGLVERLPQNGFRVTRLELETIRDLFSIRGVLEAYGVELACERIDPKTIETLRSIRDQAARMLESTDIPRETKLRRIFEFNSQFHETIYRSTNSRYLMDLISNLRNTVLRLRALGVRKKGSWKQALNEHSRLIDCLEKRDKKAAGRLMRRHIANAMSHVLSQWSLGEETGSRTGEAAAGPKRRARRTQTKG
ncbi:MAG: GntR family transcriptional regulator [Deltaproteobacteria bacterium]|nr:GntR family transcriptional regulator [Deltaproteobacteria bacterium]